MNKEDLKQNTKLKNFQCVSVLNYIKLATKTLRKKLLEYGIRVRGQTEYTTRRRNLLKIIKNLVVKQNHITIILRKLVKYQKMRLYDVRRLVSGLQSLKEQKSINKKLVMLWLVT